MIKIISGYSHAAGSTLALINLCNEFNSRGHVCTFYGPDNWHVDKCRSGSLDDFRVEAGDIVIANDIPLFSIGDLSNLKVIIGERGKRQVFKTLRNSLLCLLPSKKSDNFRLLLTCLSGESMSRTGVRPSLFQKFHFSSTALPGYSRIRSPKFVSPGFCSDLKRSENKPEKTAGIIGSIKRQNNIAIAIEQALSDGMETVTIFGYMKDPIYFYEEIVPLTIRHRGRIKYAGFMDDKQKMYDAISDVYSSVHKPWSLVSQECAMTDTGYHAPESASTDVRMTNEQIFQVWKNELAL